jgi:hypothetical protein
LGLRNALFSGFAKPVHRFGGVLGHALTVVITTAQAEWFIREVPAWSYED